MIVCDFKFCIIKDSSSVSFLDCSTRGHWILFWDQVNAELHLSKKCSFQTTVKWVSYLVRQFPSPSQAFRSSLPRWHLDCNIMRNCKLVPLRQTVPRFLTFKNAVTCYTLWLYVTQQKCLFHSPNCCYTSVEKTHKLKIGLET